MTALLAATHPKAPPAPFFDTTGALGWAVPLLMLALVFTFVLMVLGVRTRRATANLAMAAIAVALVALALITRARYGQAAPYIASYEWLNLAVTVNGAIQFQNLIVNLDLRLDPFAIAEIATVLVTALLLLGWSRTGARAEPGVPRLHILVLMFVLGAVGISLTPNLAGILAYWGVAAIATYLLLSNRWGTPETAGARIGLYVPFAGDIAFLCGIALLYSRYGVTDTAQLPGLVHTTLAAGQKSLTAACLLIVIGVAVRAALVPLHGWLTTTAGGPPPASALVQGAWPLLAGGIVFRMLPLVSLAGSQVRLGLAIAGAASAVTAPLLALAGNRFRRGLVLVGVGQAGLGLMALAYGDPARALTALLAGAPLRAGFVLAGAAAVGAMRSDDIAEMGEAQRRMAVTALGLLVGAVGLPLAAVGGATGGTGALPWTIVYGVGVALVAAAGLRSYLGVARGQLERRRAFEPARVREALRPLPQLALGLTAVGALLVVATIYAGWLNFLGEPEEAPLAGTEGLALLGAAVVGWALAVATYGSRRVLWQRRSAAAGTRLGTWALAAWLLLDRFALSRGRFAAETIETRLPVIETAAAAAVGGAGVLLDERADGGLPLRWVTVAVGAAAVGGLLAALLAPGVLR